ncbi:MAG: hypothetical protein JWN34_5646 [Bryobacterales bacterium]|nr:hypothetical protein [Bryobacterales bacterium]
MTRRVWLASFMPAVAFGQLTQKPDARAMARRIFDRANELRRARGLMELEWFDTLAACAARQCERKKILRFKGHEDPELGGVSQRLDRFGVKWSRCAENLFEMRGYDDPVNFAIVFWWYSPGHQANMLNPDFRRTGVAVTVDDDDRFFVTQIFVEA